MHQLKTKVDEIKDISRYLVKEQNGKSEKSNENMEKEISRNNLSKQMVDNIILNIRFSWDLIKFPFSKMKMGRKNVFFLQIIIYQRF